MLTYALQPSIPTHARAFCLAEQPDVAGCGRAEMNLQLAFANLYLVALFKPAIPVREGRGMGKTEHLALLGQDIEPESILLVGAGSRDTGSLSAGSAAAPMVRMAVGPAGWVRVETRLAMAASSCPPRRQDRAAPGGSRHADEEFWANWVTRITSNFNMLGLSCWKATRCIARLLGGKVVETGEPPCRRGTGSLTAFVVQLVADT